MSKEHAYAYEAGYRDGSIHYELEHCPACKNIADRQEALAENDKLRELVRDMFGAYKGTVEMLPSSYSKDVAERAVMDISDRMRELGVDE